MTEENYIYRTSQALLRNQFPGKGKLKIPVIPKFQENPGDFDDLLLIGFDKTHPEDQNHLDRMVHFFLYDYRFERVWKNPDNDIEKLSRYRAVLSPDFSIYLEMAPVMQLYLIGGAYKGGGSAYGGKWKPSKPDDERFLGEPGSINRTADRNGDLRETKIGADGRAVKERHYSNHGNPKQHSIPHDHNIVWEGNRPNWGKAENYWGGDIPDFKSYWRCGMPYRILKSKNSLEDNRFKSISDFKWCMKCGGEVEIEWNGIHYGIIRYGTDDKITIYVWNCPETECCFNTADDALEYMVGSDRLRDVITQVTVLDRSI